MPFIAAKSLILVRNTPARTTSSKLLLAAFRTADRFWKTRSVSGTMPPSTTLPVAGSWATCPLKKRKPSILTAWENGPTGGASSGEVIAVLLIATPVATSVADQSPQTHESHAQRTAVVDLDGGRENRPGATCAATAIAVRAGKGGLKYFA